MMPRSQIAALAVLLVGLGLVLVFVGDTGISTSLRPTETNTPTATASPTATPEPSAENWSMTAPGQYTYAADPNLSAQLVYQSMPYDELISTLSLERPADDDKYPLVSLLIQIRAELESQANETQLTLEPDSFSGPAIEIVENIPVATMRLSVAKQTAVATGQEFPGLDLVQMFIEQSDGQVIFLQYILRSEPNPTVYNDFRVWLADNIVEITAVSAETSPEGTPATAAPTAEATTPEPTAEGTLEPTAEVTEESAPEPTTEAAEDVTPEPTAEAAEESAPEPTAEAAEDVTPEPTLEVTEATTPEPAVESTPEAAGTEISAAPAEKWMEMAPGQLLYASNPGAFIQYAALPLDEFAASTGLVAAEGEAAPSVEDVLIAIRGDLEAQIATNGIAVEEDALQGPLTEAINGVAFVYLHLTLPPQTGADGQPQPGQEVELGVIETGENRMTIVQFIYQGDPDPAIYADFREWLTENIERLSVLEITEPEAPPAPETEPTAESD